MTFSCVTPSSVVALDVSVTFVAACPVAHEPEWEAVSKTVEPVVLRLTLGLRVTQPLLAETTIMAATSK